MHSREHGHRLLSHIHACKNGGRLRDAGQPLVQQLGGQVVQVQVDVVLVLADATALPNNAMS